MLRKVFRVSTAFPLFGRFIALCPCCRRNLKSKLQCARLLLHGNDFGVDLRGFLLRGRGSQKGWRWKGECIDGLSLLAANCPGRYSKGNSSTFRTGNWMCISLYQYTNMYLKLIVCLCVSVSVWECLSAVVTHGIWATIVACWDAVKGTFKNWKCDNQKLRLWQVVKKIWC